MDLLVQNNDFWRSLLIDLLVQNYDLWRSLFWISGFHCQPSFHGSPYGKVFFCSKRFLADWLAASLGGWGAGWLPRFQPSNYVRTTFPICMHLRFQPSHFVFFQPSRFVRRFFSTFPFCVSNLPGPCPTCNLIFRDYLCSELQFTGQILRTG